MHCVSFYIYRYIVCACACLYACVGGVPGTAGCTPASRGPVPSQHGGLVRREGGAARSDDVDWNEGVSVPGQNLDARGNSLRELREDTAMTLFPPCLTEM